MTLSADELGILEYLKSWNGKFVPMMEICRRAGGRRRYEESQHWARALMSRLVDLKLVQVNERGHYRVPVAEKPKPAAHQPAPPPKVPLVVAEDYFPPAPAAAEEEQPKLLVDENYFPPAEPDGEAERWISPQIAEILKKSGKKLGSKHSAK